MASVATIAATHGRLSPTWDESNHIAAGMEPLQDGQYTLFSENPPFARVAVALGPYLDGARLPSEGRSRADVESTWSVTWNLGDDVLNETGDTRGRIAQARRGTLFFFVLGAAVLWLWIAPFSRPSALLAIAIYCTHPSILAHAGLATTDLAFASVFLLATWRLIRWIEAPSTARAAALGGVAGLLVATKFTGLVFFPVLVVATASTVLIANRGTGAASPRTLLRRALPLATVAAPVAFVVLWGAYGFSVGHVADLPATVCGYPVYGDAVEGLRGSLGQALLERTIPMPELVHGLLMLASHNEAGHSAYALGQVRTDGFWFFYPLALAVKSPLPFLVLLVTAFVAAFAGFRRLPWSSAAVLGTIPLILIALLASNVNIGSRHILAVNALAAAAIGLVVPHALPAIRPRWSKFVTTSIVALVVWQAGVAASAFPHFLSYFNSIAAHDPAAYLVDSDLDWGQGVFELEAFCANRGIESLHVALNGSADHCAYNLPALRALQPHTPVEGWVAISEYDYRGLAPFVRSDPPCGLESVVANEGERPFYAWLDEHRPVAVLANSIRVYHITPAK
ncbi:MAG: hypothetical protein WBM75_16870 [Polyangiales bacterium]